MKIKLGMGLHWREHISFQEICSQIEEAEALGFSQIWVSNEKFFHDMYVLATVASEHTKNIKRKEKNDLSSMYRKRCDNPRDYHNSMSFM